MIGSGATAMTLVPAMAMSGARHVVMVQRSPTYVVSWPSQDRTANFLRRILPVRWAYAITRWKNVRRLRRFYRLTRTRPERVKAVLLKMVRQALGPDFDPAEGPSNDNALTLHPIRRDVSRRAKDAPGGPRARDVKLTWG